MTFRTALIVASIGMAVSLPARILAEDDPLDALNQTIQARFAGVDKFFGLRRIVVLGDTPHRFAPETVSEEAVVQELRDAKLQVALYMAGRRVLEREPNLKTDVPGMVDRRVIFGPIAVTSFDRLAELPHSTDLIDEARRAFGTLQHRDRYNFDMAGWKYSARAVRVTSNECLTCHAGRKQGDPLGVVMYAYR